MRVPERVYAARGTEWRILPMRANGQPAFAAYVNAGGEDRLHTLQVLTFAGSRMSRNTVYMDQDVFDTFGLRSTLS